MGKWCHYPQPLNFSLKYPEIFNADMIIFSFPPHHSLLCNISSSSVFHLTKYLRKHSLSGLANFFCKSSDSKYFGLLQTVASLLWSPSSAVLTWNSRRENVSEWVWCVPVKPYLWTQKFELYVIFMCNETLFFRFFFPQSLKNVRTIFSLWAEFSLQA